MATRTGRTGTTPDETQESSEHGGDSAATVAQVVDEESRRYHAKRKAWCTVLTQDDKRATVQFDGQEKTAVVALSDLRKSEPDTSVDTKAERLEEEAKAEVEGRQPLPPKAVQRVRVVATRLGQYAQERKKPGAGFVMEFQADKPIKLPSWVVREEDYVPPKDPIKRNSDGRGAGR